MQYPYRIYQKKPHSCSLTSAFYEPGLKIKAGFVLQNAESQLSGHLTYCDVYVQVICEGTGHIFASVLSKQIQERENSVYFHLILNRRDST